MTDLPRFEIIKEEDRQSLLIQFEDAEWVDYEKALDILSIRLRPILEAHIYTMMDDRSVRAVAASVQRFLGAMEKSGFIFQRRGKWDLDEEW